MTNVETLPTRKFEMSKLKLIIAGLSLWFSNRRGWWRQEGGSSWKGVGKGRVGIGKETSWGWGNLENFRNILGHREWNHCRKGMGSESQRYFKWRVHTPCPSPPPPTIKVGVTPDWSHYVITFKFKNQILFVCITICLLYTMCSCQELTGISRCCKRHIIEPFNPFTLTSDQRQNSPYNISTISTKEVMRTKKNINLGTISWSNTKSSEITL